MAKKIYDILPPKVANKLENTIRESDKKIKKTAPRARKKAVAVAPLAAPATRQSKQRPTPMYPEEKHLPLKEALIGSAIILVLVLGYLFTKLPKADIKISPATQEVSFEEKVTANKSITEVSAGKKTIPVTSLQEERSASQEFTATGTASNDGKATGTITIYNKLDPASALTLLKGTHFLSNGGKYFITTQKLTIPAAKWQGGKLISGQITAAVVAKEAGEEYNIGASKFSIPKLSGTNYYYRISAESTSSMKGGYIGQVKKITKGDIDAAKQTLRSNVSEFDILLDSAIAREVKSFKPSATEGTIAEKFTAEAKIKIWALVFKKQDFDIFAKNAITSRLANDESYLEESLDLTYDFDVIDISQGAATVTMKVAVKTYKSVDVNSLVNLVSMEDKEQVKQTITRIYPEGISDIQVDFWPFWVKSAPKDKDRIHINLDFGE